MILCNRGSGFNPICGRVYEFVAYPRDVLENFSMVDSKMAYCSIEHYYINYLIRRRKKHIVILHELTLEFKKSLKPRPSKHLL